MIQNSHNLGQMRSINLQKATTRVLSQNTSSSLCTFDNFFSYNHIFPMQKKKKEESFLYGSQSLNHEDNLMASHNLFALYSCLHAIMFPQTATYIAICTNESGIVAWYNDKKPPTKKNPLS